MELLNPTRSRLLGCAVILLSLVVPIALAQPGAPPKKGAAGSTAARVKVPNVVGMRRMQAQVALLRARLNYVEAAEHHLTTDRTKEGTVAMQDPGAGSEVVARTPVRVMLYVYSPQSGGTGKIGESK